MSSKVNLKAWKRRLQVIQYKEIQNRPEKFPGDFFLIILQVKIKNCYPVSPQLQQPFQHFSFVPVPKAEVLKVR